MHAHANLEYVLHYLCIIPARLSVCVHLFYCILFLLTQPKAGRRLPIPLRGKRHHIGVG